MKTAIVLALLAALVICMGCQSTSPPGSYGAKVNEREK
jgi:hypothetical protein